MAERTQRVPARKKRAHSSITKLPAEILTAIEAQLHAGATYQELADHLGQLGHPVSRSAVGRWGQATLARQARLEASADLARLLSERLGDGELEHAATLLALDLVVGTLMDHEGIEPTELNLPHVTNLMTALSKVSTAALAREKWRVDVERRAAEAAEAVAGKAREGGLSDETVEFIKRRILGVTEGIG